MSTYNARLDFDQALFQHRMQSLKNLVFGQRQSDDLSEVRSRQIIDRGVQTILVDKIAGSASGNQNFDNDFNPRRENTRQRWVNIRQAHYEDRGLPAIEVYQLEDTYYVIDGHHRVSVARFIGKVYIDAHVKEIVSTVAMDVGTEVCYC